jgi:signal peptidase
VPPREKKRSFLSSIKSFIIAPLVFLIILGAVFAYSGIWPPLVVVESKSMQHGTESSIGIIDTGDIVVVKDVSSVSDVVPYLDGVATGYKTYGEPGDVIVYYKSGMAKPIIHRAICNLIFNKTGGGFDIPALKDIPSEMWALPGAEKVWWNIKTTLELYDIGYMRINVEIKLGSMLAQMGSSAHGGLITMGDYNWFVEDNVLKGRIDQSAISAVRNEPIIADWIIGKARGELPWFGLLKLYVSGGVPSDAPKNSQTNLLVSLALIIVVPIGLDVANSVMKSRGVELFGWTRRLSPRRLWRRPKDGEPPG